MKMFSGRVGRLIGYAMKNIRLFQNLKIFSQLKRTKTCMSLHKLDEHRFNKFYQFTQTIHIYKELTRKFLSQVSISKFLEIFVFSGSSMQCFIITSFMHHLLKQKYLKETRLYSYPIFLPTTHLL